MLNLLLRILLNGLGLLLTALVVPGVTYSGGFLYLFLAGIVLGLVNALVKPLVTLLSLPLIVLTLGLFYLVINGAMLGLTALLLPRLSVDGCLPALLGGVVLAVFNLLTGWIARRER